MSSAPATGKARPSCLQPRLRRGRCTSCRCPCSQHAMLGGRQPDLSLPIPPLIPLFCKLSASSRDHAVSCNCHHECLRKPSDDPAATQSTLARSNFPSILPRLPSCPHVKLKQTSDALLHRQVKSPASCFTPLQISPSPGHNCDLCYRNSPSGDALDRIEPPTPFNPSQILRSAREIPFAVSPSATKQPGIFC